VAGRVALNGFLLLLGSLFVGSHVLEFFGLTLPVVRVAGGLVVTAAGWGLLNQEIDSRAAPTTETAGKEEPDAFFPLTLPLTVGPGSITVAITLGSQRPQGMSGIRDLALVAGGAVAGLVAIALTIYVCYRFAGHLERVLGKDWHERHAAPLGLHPGVHRHPNLLGGRQRAADNAPRIAIS